MPLRQDRTETAAPVQKEEPVNRQLTNFSALPVPGPLHFGDECKREGWCVDFGNMLYSAEIGTQPLEKEPCLKPNKSTE